MSFLEQNDPLWQELARMAQEDGLRLYDAERMGDQGLRVVLTRDLNAEAAEQVSAGDESPGVDAPQVTSDAALVTSDASRADSRSQSVTSRECSKFCKRLMVFFSVEGPRFRLALEPQIEVSSPGINRTLRMPEHFSGAVGERVKVTSLTPQQRAAAEAAPRKKDAGSLVTGVLEQFSEQRLTIRDEQTGQPVEVPLAEVKSARVDFVF